MNHPTRPASAFLRLLGGRWTDAIQASEERLWKRALQRWSRDPRIEVLGSPEARRLSIASLRIRHGDRYLHHNHVLAALNDLLGSRPTPRCSPKVMAPRNSPETRRPLAPNSL